MSTTAMDVWVKEIKEIMESARMQVASDVNRIMIETYWRLGRSIIEHEQDGELKAQYGKRILSELSKRLSLELGKGYSRSNLYNMRGFYASYPNFPDASGKLKIKKK